MIKTIVTLFFVLSLSLGSQVSSQTTGMEPFCSLEINNELLCKNFNSFQQLDFTKSKLAYSTLTLWPQDSLKLELNENLKLNGLELTDNSKILFYNIHTINIAHNPFKNIKTPKNSIQLEFSNSYIKFHQNQKVFDCSLDPSGLKTLEFVFSDLNIDSFILNSCDFDPIFQICPLVFKNTTINKFEINRVTKKMKLLYDPVKIINSNLATSVNELLNVNIYELYVKFTENNFVTILNNENLLNLDLFEKLRMLELNRVQLESIDSASMLNMKNLKSLRLLAMDVEKLLKNGVDWMSALNSQVDLDLSDKNVVANLKKEDFFELVFVVSAKYPKLFEFGDDSYCYFKNFPHNRLLVPVFYFTEFDQLKNVLPCSCNIYNMYKYYSSYSGLIKQITGENKLISNERYFPTYCFNVSETINNEQIEFCKNQNYEKTCDPAYTTVSEPQFSEPPTQVSSCLKPDLSPDNSNASLCKCYLSTFKLNILDCTDKKITQLPVDFQTDSQIEFDFVSFAGSSTSSISKNQFNNLRLTENATIQLLNIDSFENDLFVKSLIYKKSFRLVIKDSSLITLAFNTPFRDTSFTQLEFKNFSLPESILAGNFLGSKIDTLIFNTPQANSFSPFFRQQPSFEKIEIKKLKIENVNDVFKKTSPNGKFDVDILLLNQRVFEELEELEIAKTQIDSIDSDFLNKENNLPNLKTIRFETIGLKKIINSELSLNYSKPNWLSRAGVKRVYLGHEIDPKFTFDDDQLCYFLDLNKDTTIYMYDNLDLSNGIQCTCTVYWIYRNLNFDLLNTDPDAKYIPNCVRNLKSQENLQTQLVKCLNNRDPMVYCKEPKIAQITTTTNTQITTTTNTQITTANNLTTTSSTTTNLIVTQTVKPEENFNSGDIKAMKGLLIAVTVIVSILIVGMAAGFGVFTVVIFKFVKKTTTSVFPMNPVNPQPPTAMIV